MPSIALRVFASALAFGGVLLSSACSVEPAEEDVAVSTEAVTTSTLLFRDTFEGRTSALPWRVSRDGSVDCAVCPAKDSDVATYLSAGWSAPYGTALTVHANPTRRACTHTNAIAHRPVPFRGRGNYRVELDMRQWRTDGPYRTHQIDVNYTYSRAAGWDATKRKYVWVDRFSEVGVMLNPYDRWYGWLYMKTAGSTGAIRGIADLRPRSKTWATDWHHIVVNNIVAPAEGIFRVESIYCDGSWYVVREPMGTFLHEVVQPWQWADNETLLLEAATIWNQCARDSSSEGIGVYDNVEVSHIPF